jgi:hydroxymethylpyrimidine/phosphomethylpyrimidine kinase
LGHRSKIKYRIRLSQYRKSKRFSKILKIDLITPNYHEIIQLSPAETNAENIAKMLSAHCAILLKGGHQKKLVSILYIQKEIIPFLPKIIAHRKNGSGCVLSSAIVSNLALGNDLRTIRII